MPWSKGHYTASNSRQVRCRSIGVKGAGQKQDGRLTSSQAELPNVEMANNRKRKTTKPKLKANEAREK